MTLGKRNLQTIFGAALCTAALSSPLGAQEKPEVRIGTIVSVTGGASSLGAPERNAIEVFKSGWLPKADLPFKVTVISYDDGSDPTKSVNLTRKLIEEDKVHVVVCCTTTPGSLAIIDTVTGTKTPMISMASASAIVAPAKDRPFTFKITTSDQLMLQRTMAHMKRNNIKRLAFMGLEDSYGETGLREARNVAKAEGIELIATERFARQDTSFTSQSLRVRQAQPDAVYIHAIPPSAALVHEALKRVGYTGPIYHGAGSSILAFIDIGKGNVDGAIVGVGALNIYDQISAQNPMRPGLMEFAGIYDQAYGKGKVDLFAGQGWDAVMMAVHGAKGAFAKGAKPDDLAGFRVAVRDALESTKNYVGVNGIFNFGPDDHLGLDKRSTFLSKVEKGRFVLIEE